MGQRHYKESMARGKKSEDKFDIAASKYSWIHIRNANKSEQLHEHWDKLLYIDGLETKVEVKGPKRFHRYKGIQYDYILLELHGVDRFDNDGWVFGSKAEYIAFELKEQFVCFTLLNIKRLIEETIGISRANDPAIWDLRILSPTYKDSPHNETIPYQIYHRLDKDGNDNFDSFVWFPLKDLLKLDHFMMKK